jgi:hypothetical protein
MGAEMVVYAALLQFVQSKAGLAILLSVVAGVVFTFIWANAAHAIAQWKYPELKNKDRGAFIPAFTGALERLLLTITAIWLQPAVGPIAAAIIAVKVVLQWGDLDGKSRSARTRYLVSFTNNLVSITWAIAWGIWGHN